MWKHPLVRFALILLAGSIITAMVDLLLDIPKMSFGVTVMHRGMYMAWGGIIAMLMTKNEAT